MSGLVGKRCGRFSAVAAIVFLGLLCGQAAARTEPVTARAVVNDEPLLQGSSARIAVEIVIDSRYHIQSAKPLDPYLIATAVSVKKSDGITAEAPSYPVGDIIEGPGDNGATTRISAYRGTVYLLVPIKIASNAALGKRTLALSLTTQACDSDSCLPPSTKTLSVEVTITAAGTPSHPQNATLFAAADQQKFNQPATKPATPPPVAPAQPTTVAVPATAPAGVRLMTVDEELAAIKARHYQPYNKEHYPITIILLLALVGGVILNIMPCVLPVIPLKVLSLIQQTHGDRRLAVLHGLAFSAGIIALFLALAVILKTAGLFYGQQFQRPEFLIAMVFFVVALALSMLGVWTLNPPKALYAVEGKTPHVGYLGSFTNGLMATLLATPCSAPYLGAPLAWAFAQPAWLTTLTLGVVGVGMALPYLFLAMFPAALSKIPRAGRWSDLLKQGLGIIMLGVAVYLITLIPNASLWPWVMMGCVLVGLVCWAWGQIPTYNMAAGKIWMIRGTAVVIGAGIGILLTVFALRDSTVVMPSEMTNQDGWQSFNVALLDHALSEGRPVVVDWTASWCINCHFLEATVLSTSAVKTAFQSKNALLLKADLSTDNPPATLLNHELGGESIPVLAIFAPSRKFRPVVLRDLYTRNELITQINAAH